MIILDNKIQMIKNSLYTFDYFQPEEYHFSLDSVFLAQKVAKIIQENTLHEMKVLDLCSGCGVIGLELSLHTPKELTIDFLEVQEIYESFFHKNVELVYPQMNKSIDQYRFIKNNYETLLEPRFENLYDLIICNPPYFFKGEGLLSPSEFKNRCRFFLDSDFKTLIKAILAALKPNCNAYILVRPGDNHGRNPIEEITHLLDVFATAQVIDNIRGTNIVEIRKKIV